MTIIRYNGTKWMKVDRSGMFFGQFDVTIDDKGRVKIPAKLRDKIEDEIYITKGLDHCLFIFMKEEWNELQDKLKTLPLTNKNARAFTRFFNAGAMNVNLDKQGRVNLASHLIDYAKLKKDLYVVGIGSRIEIWSKDEWDDYTSPSNLSFEDIAEQMQELGI